ncbi:uncharacterized protein LOC133192539 isoform X1 [Saccostrea echinata]|uniref:uncharacterized protein LOC133192470 isoform X1 n=1 Tax=Saccostrea echinata TaxID=191078 RepID=UPI002A81AA50|nr:uncharacterized protein LOC133192470 isoform X1 [Saccostrea echinata]XP_061184517.1 uncharacterized protein LOC133192539 isoform X1 [Saccostrea echinata]
MISSFSWTSLSIVLVFITLSESACTFPSEITGDWYSAYKGKLSFNSTHLSGYPIYMSASVQSLDFECYINSDRTYLLRATETALVFGQYIRGYLCIQLWRVSSTKYYYYHGTTISPTNKDHIKGVIDILKNGTLEETCDIAEPYNTSSFVMLVKDGTITTGASEATCATDLLASYSSVSITDSTGSTSCSPNVMDGCTDRTEMRFTYASGCGNTQKFSTGGFWTCMHSMSSGGNTYLSVWNNDSSVVGTTSYTYASGVNYQFACLVISGSSATMFPNYCSDSTQTASTVASPGLTMAFTGATQTCYDEVEGGSSAVYYITIVLGALFIIALIILIIILKKKGYCSLQKCKKQRPSSPESSVEQGEHVTNTVFKMNKLDPIPGFRAKRPLRIGPIVEPNLDILPKVEPLYALSDKKDTSKPAKRDDDTISVDSVDEDNPFNFYNIAKFVLLPKIVSKKSFDVGALADPKRNTLHDILEIKKSKLKRESKASEEQETKNDKSRDEKDKEKDKDKKKTTGKPKLEKQSSKEPKPGDKNRKMSKK